MARAKLEFDLTDPDDVKAHKRAVKSTDMAYVLFELFDLHKRMEWIIESKDVKDPYEVVDRYKQAIADLFEEHGIDVDELL
jgi:nicotinamide mononucleotide adenylyltransferase